MSLPRTLPGSCAPCVVQRVEAGRQTLLTTDAVRPERPARDLQELPRQVGVSNSCTPKASRKKMSYLLGLLDELPSVAHVGAHALVLDEPERTSRNVPTKKFQRQSDLRHVDLWRGVVRAQDIGKRPSAETTTRIRRGLRTAPVRRGRPAHRAIQMIRSPVSRRFGRSASFEEQRAQAPVILGDDDGVVRRGLLVDYGLGRASRNQSVAERRRAKMETNRPRAFHAPARPISAANRST